MSRVLRVLPTVLAVGAVRPSAPRWQRLLAAAGLLFLWKRAYGRYRREGRARTAVERDQLATATRDAFSRHYNERVPTVEEEFAIWDSEYHRHRHEMRYDEVARVARAHLPTGGRLLDVGCGSALVADRLNDVDATYIGADFGGHHIRFASEKPAGGRLGRAFVRGDAESVPLRDAAFDVVVMSEVIEHLLFPEVAVWEVARVLRPGGCLVLTTNNASEMPPYAPINQPLAWLEKALGATRPELISLRPWVWPVPVDRDLLPEGSPDVYLPHTHHIAGETADLLYAAGLQVQEWSTFEFPPPQSASAAFFASLGAPGRHAVDVVESVARRIPLVRRLGCHLFVVATKVAEPVAPQPPPGVWPGPLTMAETAGA